MVWLSWIDFYNSDDFKQTNSQEYWRTEAQASKFVCKSFQLECARLNPKTRTHELQSSSYICCLFALRCQICANERTAFLCILHSMSAVCTVISSITDSIWFARTVCSMETIASFSRDRIHLMENSKCGNTLTYPIHEATHSELLSTMTRYTNGCSCDSYNCDVSNEHRTWSVMAHTFMTSVKK